MLPLRAYLLLRFGEKEWDVSIHRELEPLIDAWQKRPNPEISGAVHIGFGRPDSDAFEEVLAPRPGKVVVTASAKFALPASFKCSAGSLTKIDGMPVYLGLSGWGYEVDADIVKEPLMITTQDQPMECSDAENHYNKWLSGFESFVGEDHTQAHNSSDDWLTSFRQSFPKLYEEAAGAGVEDDASYLRLEASISPLLRENLGKFRFEYRCSGIVSAESIFDNLKNAPPWMLKLPISILMLSTRSSNVMFSNKIILISNLARYSSEEVLKFNKIGRKSFFEIGQKLLDILSGGPNSPLIQSYVFEKNFRSVNLESKLIKKVQNDLFSIADGFKKAISHAIDVLNTTQKTVIELRMGVNCEPKTLQQIAEKIGVSRERIRQIEVKGLSLIKKLPYWDSQLNEKLVSMLENRREPLPFEGIEILDPWFEGIENCRSVFVYAIENFMHNPFYLIQHEHIFYLAEIKPTEWLEVCKAARKMMEGMVGKRVSETDLRQLVEGLLLGGGESLRELLWGEATKCAHFANGCLVSYGFGTEHLVRAILENSERPLHYTEVLQLLLKQGEDTDIRRAQNCCGNVGLLLGRGIYGMHRHFNLTESEIRGLIDEVESLVASGEVSRQWHTRELCDYLEENNLDLEGRVNHYTLNIALKSSKMLNYLGRMVWGTVASGAKNTANRLDIHQAIVSVLIEAHRPLTTEEIKGRLLEERGLNCFFQIQPEGDLVRLGQSYWGLMNRDIPFSDGNLQVLVNTMERVLRVKGKGVHSSEIKGVLLPVFPIASEIEDPFTFFGIAQKYPQFALAKGQYLYLAEWKTPRRYNMTEAVVRVLKDAGSIGVTVEDAMHRVSILIERPWPKNVFFGQQACSHGGVFDPDTELWHYHESESMEES
jgi:hypothetical protein